MVADSLKLERTQIGPCSQHAIRPSRVSLPAPMHSSELPLDWRTFNLAPI